MEENYLITIKGTMEQRGDTDTVELLTRSSLVPRTIAYYIVYKETETTGYEGCTTTVQGGRGRAQGLDAAVRQAVRASSSSRKGTRHLCHYETGYELYRSGRGRRRH